MIRLPPNSPLFPSTTLFQSPTADALRRALESRSATMYKPRGAVPAARSRAERLPPARPLPSLPGADVRRPRGRDRWERGERGERGGRRRDLAPATPGGEAAIVRDLRNRFVTWASVCGSLVVIDVATGSHLPGWSLIVAGIWAGAALVPRYVPLWHPGDSWRDVLARPPAPDAIAGRVGATARGGGQGGARPADLPEGPSGE